MTTSMATCSFASKSYVMNKVKDEKKTKRILSFQLSHSALPAAGTYSVLKSRMSKNCCRYVRWLRSVEWIEIIFSVLVFGLIHFASFFFWSGERLRERRMASMVKYPLDSTPASTGKKSDEVNHQVSSMSVGVCVCAHKTADAFFAHSIFLTFNAIHLRFWYSSGNQAKRLSLKSRRKMCWRVKRVVEWFEMFVRPDTHMTRYVHKEVLLPRDERKKQICNVKCKRKWTNKTVKPNLKSLYIKI